MPSTTLDSPASCAQPRNPRTHAKVVIVFENRYGADDAEARHQFVEAITGVARAIVTTLQEHPTRAPGPYPLVKVRQMLGVHSDAVREALHRYPLAIAVDTQGRPEKLGEELAKLTSALSWVLTFYYGLPSVPQRFEGRFATDMLAIEKAASGVVIVAEQWG
ncbi:MAG: hypothetical protein QOF58_3253 [Pseudonocardiales bacterium]|nr:hypothetical protein [Pseudonocardiales bacterium]